jgi:site-specific DNA-methyltransferase (adenine-specific)
MDKFINKIINSDSLKIMKKFPNKIIDVVITDPPYGKKWTRGVNAIGLLKDKNENDKTIWDIKPSKEYFDEIIRISKNQIIFGGNYFTNYLPQSNCWLVWDKVGSLKLGKQIPFADCELIWTSFNKVVKKFVFIQQGFIKETNDIRQHPTQKPTEVMKWIIENYTKPTDIILDPFVGSGTTCVAAKQLGRKYIGIEISSEYCKIANERLAQEVLF